MILVLHNPTEIIVLETLRNGPHFVHTFRHTANVELCCVLPLKASGMSPFLVDPMMLNVICKLRCAPCSPATCNRFVKFGCLVSQYQGITCCLQDWLIHPKINLAAYFPIFTGAGFAELQVG